MIQALSKPQSPHLWNGHEIVAGRGNPFQGPRPGSCLTLENELSKVTLLLTKEETLLRRGAQVESRRVKETKRTSLPHGLQSRVLCDGISFWVVFGQSFWLRVPPDNACIAQPRWMPARRILGGGRTRGISFGPFLNSAGWWWLVSSVFLTGISCHKIIHTNGYYSAWPGWAVSVRVLRLTQWILPHDFVVSTKWENVCKSQTRCLVYDKTFSVMRFFWL